MAIKQLDIVIGRTGMPDKAKKSNEDKADKFYDLGKSAAEISIQKDMIDAQKQAADMYSSMVMAQSKMMLNTVLLDIARLLAEVKVNNMMMKAYMQNILGPNAGAPNLTPLLAQAGGEQGMMPPGGPPGTEPQGADLGMPPPGGPPIPGGLPMPGGPPTPGAPAMPGGPPPMA